MIADLKSDGGDLRLSGDIGGNTQYPIEIVDGLDIVWTLVPSVAVDTLVYVWGDKPTAVKEIDTATYGSEAAWTNSKLRSHLGATIYDSTGNASLNFDNSVEVTGQIGSGRDYNGSSQYGRFNDAGVYSNLEGKAKSSVWFRPDSGQTGKALICFNKTNTSNYKHLLYVSGNSQSIATYVRLTNGTVYAVGYDTGARITGWHRLSATFDKSLSSARLKLYYDGALVGTSDAENLDVGDNSDGVSLARWGGSNSYGGKIDEYDLSTDVTADKETIEYQNQSATGAWWIATDAGGGPVTQTLTPTATASEENFGTPSLATGLVTVTAIGIASEEAIGDVNLASGATLLTPESTTSQEALGEPELLEGEVLLAPDSVLTAEVLGEPNVLTGDIVIEPASVTSQEVLGDPNLLIGATALTTESITTEEALGLISLLSQSVVLVSSITSAEIVGNPELAYEQTISVVSAHNGETIGNAKVLGGVAVLNLNTVYRDVMSDVYRTTMRDGYDIRT